jgi:hypothetical protein
MGKGAAKQSETALAAQSGIAQQELDIGKQLLGETAPARQQALSTYTGLSKGNMPGIQAYVAPQINAATQQFYQARRAALALPPGGQRDQALRDVNLQESASKNQIYSGGVSESTARLASLGMGGTQTGVGAYGTAGQTMGQVAQGYGSLASSKGAQAASMFGGLGGALAGI